MAIDQTLPSVQDDSTPMPPTQVAAGGGIISRVARKVAPKIAKSLDDFNRNDRTPNEINNQVSGVGSSTPVEAQEVVDNTQLGRVVDPARQPYRNFSLEYINTPDDVLAIMDDAAMQTGEIGALSTKHQTNAETVELAGGEDLSIDGFLKRKPGNWTAAQLTAGRTALVQGAEEIYQMAQMVQANPGDIKTAYAFRKALATHSAMQRTIEGAVNEAGRVLQSMQISIGSDTISVPAMTAKLHELDSGVGTMGSSTDRIANLILESGGDPMVVSRAADESWGKRTIDAVIEVWINGLLSGPQTHLVNIVGNSAAAAMAVGEKYVATAIGKARKKLNDFGGPGLAGAWDGDAASWAEPSAMMTGLVDGLINFHKAFARSMRQGEAAGNDLLAPGAVKTDLTYKPSFTADNLGVDPTSAFGALLDGIGQYYVRIPGQVLQASDEGFKSAAYLMESNRFAVQAAISEGLEPGTEAYQKKVSDIIQGEDLVYSMPANESAVNFAKYQTFTNEATDSITQGSMALAKVPLVKLYVPFIKVVSNLLKYGIERSPVSPFVSAKWKAEWAAGGATRDLAVAKLSMGSATSIGVWAMMNNTEIDSNGDTIMRPLITGAGPKSNTQRKVWQKMGIKPWSIYIGGKYIPYNRLDPVGQIIGQTAVALELANGMYNGPERDAAIFAIAAGMGEYLTDKTYFQGFAELMDVAGGNRSLANSAANRVGSFVPSWLNTVKKVTDRDEKDGYIIRETKGDGFLGTVINKLQYRVPGLSDGLQPKIGIFGEEVVLDDMGWFMHSLSPVQYSMVKTDETVATELFEQGYGWMEPKPQLTVDLAGTRSVAVDLLSADPTGDLFRRYSVALGKAQYLGVKLAMAEPEYARLRERSDTEDVGRVWRLRQAAQKARRQADKDFKANEQNARLLQIEARKQLKIFDGSDGSARPETGDALEPNPGF